MTSTVAVEAPTTQPPFKGPIRDPFDYTPTPTEVDKAARYADYTVTYSTPSDRRMKVRDDGWTEVGLVFIDEEKAQFELVFFAGLTFSDMEALDRIVSAVRNGRRGAMRWTQGRSKRDYVVALVGTARREATAKKGGLRAQHVIACADRKCGSYGSWHIVNDDRGARHLIEDVLPGGGGTTRVQPWELVLSRYEGSDWQVKLHLLSDVSLSGAQIAALTSDLRWAAEEARRCNEKRAE